MEYEKCYVFQPEDGPPAKKRRTEPQGLQASWALRRTTYTESWQIQQQRIDQKLSEINAAAVTQIVEYLRDLQGQQQLSSARIPAGLIVTGPRATAYASTLDQVFARVKASGSSTFVSISSNVGGNCKALLKLINQKGTSSSVDDGEEGDNDSAPNNTIRGPRLLNYDLEILHTHVRDNKIRQVVIAFEDTEAFDSGLLSELLDLLSYWTDRIPFVLLFRIATNVEVLQQRLSKSAVRCLHATLFDIAPSTDEVEEVLEVLTSSGGKSGHAPSIWLGGGLVADMIERQQDYVQTIDTFVSAAKYAYMSAFYANALTVFFKPHGMEIPNAKDHVEALRNTNSFKAWAKQKLQDGDGATLRAALTGDENMMKLVRDGVERGVAAMLDIMKAVDLLVGLQVHLKLQGAPALKKSGLYVQAMNGKLRQSTFIRNLCLSIRKLPSDTALSVFRVMLETVNLPRDQDEGLYDITSKLDSLISTHSNGDKAPLRSEDDFKNSTLRTTIVAKKVELSKQKSTLSKQDAAYTKLLRCFTDILEQFLTRNLPDPKDLLFHEIFLYDLKSPHREVFTPRPRHAVERALASPHDYLACECCGPREGEDGEKDEEEESLLRNTQPPTAILYQLYLESGSLINVCDLWNAFLAVLGEESFSEEDIGITKALFQRSLSELKALGMVKPTRRKIDHIQKVMWKGL